MMTLITVIFISYLSGVSASSYGLGGLFNVAHGNAGAVFENPALLPETRGSFVFGVRQNYFMSELTDVHAAFSKSFKKFSFGLGVHKSGIKDVVSEYTVLTGLGYRISNLSAGLSSRIFYLRNLEDTNLKRTALSMDLGLFYKFFIFDFSISYLNILRPSLGFITTTEKSNSEFIMATSFKIPEPVTWSAGVNWSGSSLSYRLASELWFTRGFGLRIGILERELRMGLALKAENYGVDISFGSSRELGTTYVITTHYRL